jgi:tetrachlorobenzoquinone reductase
VPVFIFIAAVRDRCLIRSKLLPAASHQGTRILSGFSAETAPPRAEALSEFDIVLARLGLSLHIHDGKTVLETLLNAGIDITYSCMNGVCGSCRVDVLEGIPDHSDMVLTDDERASDNAIMVCCSKSRTPRLVLDLRGVVRKSRQIAPDRQHLT